jgi:hypothetical protein
VRSPVQLRILRAVGDGNRLCAGHARNGHLHDPPLRIHALVDSPGLGRARMRRALPHWEAAQRAVEKTLGVAETHRLAAQAFALTSRLGT